MIEFWCSFMGCFHSWWVLACSFTRVHLQAPIVSVGLELYGLLFLIGGIVCLVWMAILCSFVPGHQS